MARPFEKKQDMQQGIPTAGADAGTSVSAAPVQAEQPGGFPTFSSGAGSAPFDRQQAASPMQPQTPLAKRPDKIGVREIQQAFQTMLTYRTGKASVDERIVNNEMWYKVRHWETLRRDNGAQVEPVSGWLFNAIANKHADYMDNFPRPNILPREQGDVEEAKRLSSILPVVLDQAEFEDVYDRVMEYRLKTGTGVYGVFWDGSKLGGLGDIAIRQIDIINLFWESGITDIQDSHNVFYVSVVDVDDLKAQYDNYRGTGGITLDVHKYIYDDTVDTTGKTIVVDWYYHKNENGRNILHYCKFADDTVLFATENEPEKYPDGWYAHGKYPFIFDTLFRVAGSPCGFGYIDVAKNAQEYIDRGNQSILQNMLVNTKPRFFIRTDGAVNEAEYADLTRDFVHVDGNLGQDSIAPIAASRPLGGVYVNILNNKVDELKEVTGNRDISTGGSSAGVTAASAIAAMQEAGSKLSRDNIKASYRAYRKLVLMVIELIRQFYDAPRWFRILGNDGAASFVSYSNTGLQPQPMEGIMGMETGIREPLFDVEITAEKSSPYSRMAQNEMALSFYNAGFFNPQLADQALVCLDMMDFDRKSDIMQKIAENGMNYQMMKARQMAAAQVGSAMDWVAGAAKPQKNEDNHTGFEGESNITKNARERVADSTSPK